MPDNLSSNQGTHVVGRENRLPAALCCEAHSDVTNYHLILLLPQTGLSLLPATPPHPNGLELILNHKLK